MPAMKVKGTAGYRQNRVDDEVVLVHPLPEERSERHAERLLRCVAVRWMDRQVPVLPPCS